MALVFAVRLLAPADGALTRPSAESWTTAGLRVTESAGPLHAGDLVTAVNGIPVTRTQPAFAFGDTVTYTVMRGEQTLNVPVTLFRYPIPQLLRDNLWTAPFWAAMWAVCAFVIVRRPRDRSARTLYAMGLLLFLSSLAFPYSNQIVDVVTGRLWPDLIGEVASCLLWSVLLHFATVFPEPWPRRSLRRTVVITGYLLPPLLYAAAVITAQPVDLRVLVSLSTPAANVFPFLIGAAFLTGYRFASRPEGRERMRLAVYAFGLGAALYMVLGRIPEWIIGHPLLPWNVLTTLVFAPFPVALGMAVLRYRLFDIQVILRRPLVYGLVTVGLMAAYLAVAAAIGAGESVLVAAVVALAFAPAQRYLRRTVGRLVYGSRDDPYEVLTILGQRLESASSVESVLARLVETLARTLRLSYVAVEVDGLDLPSFSHGRPSGRPLEVPLIHQSEEIGRLVLDPGPRQEPFGARDSRLLDVLARQVGATAYNLLLTTRLQQSLERTVTALEDERRRLRRDIHDGLGPTLASAGMSLELALSLLPTDPDKAIEILSGLPQTHRQALADVRRLVHGLRPPALDQLGLTAALRERATHLGGDTVEIIVAADTDIEPLPAAAEVAAYHIVSESITNVVRHAAATRCSVRLERDPNALHLEISDNGTGLPNRYRAGVGLTSIRERATELGGTAHIGAAPQGGTLISVRLPLKTVADRPSTR
ncbi:histidine kinase [Actinoplanes sichuanensis]|uniref:Oxygen sensor histidine kinase NreB n=2 Tax=Actinoplanes sichuanensis TaxID=512349 RepID=A0ABW4A6D5_9ACTN|nr:histidine kinase [Actinoplanes sichuanensis]